MKWQQSKYSKRSYLQDLWSEISHLKLRTRAAMSVMNDVQRKFPQFDRMSDSAKRINELLSLMDYDLTVMYDTMKSDYNRNK